MSTLAQQRIEALTAEQANVAMKSPEHLKLWLSETGRRWLVLNSLDLVDALPWPDGVQAFLQVCMAYGGHRMAQPSGRKEVITTPTGEKVEVDVMKTDQLELEELDRAIRYLVAQAYERDPNWKLENPAL